MTYYVKGDPLPLQWISFFSVPVACCCCCCCFVWFKQMGPAAHQMHSFLFQSYQPWTAQSRQQKPKRHLSLFTRGERERERERELEKEGRKEGLVVIIQSLEFILRLSLAAGYHLGSPGDNGATGPAQNLKHSPRTRPSGIPSAVGRLPFFWRRKGVKRLCFGI